MEIKAGDYVRTPRFLEVRIKEVFPDGRSMREAGYKEPTYFADEEWEVGGKSLDMHHMEFAACKVQAD